MWRPRRRWALGLIVLGLVVVAGAPRWARALVVVEGLLPGEARWGRVWGEPVLEVVELKGSDRTVRAHLYLPPRGGRHQAAVLTVPLAEGQADNAGVVAAARALARAGMVVLVPGAEPDWGRLVEGAEDDGVLAALGYLAGHPRVDPRRLGLIGVSYGSGPVFRVAASPGWRERLRFVVSLGGYGCLRRMLRFATTGYHEAGGEVYHGHADALVREVMASVLWNWLPEPSDREVLRQHWEALFSGRAPPGVAEQLSPGGAAMYRVVTNGDDALFPRLYAELEAEVRARLFLMSPERAAAGVGGQVFLVHARDDAYVPFTESLHLWEVLPPAARARLVLVGFLEHALPVGRSRWALLRAHLADVWSLLVLVHDLLGV